MVNSLDAKNYSKDPLFTRTINEVLKHPNEPISWKGNHWKVGNKDIINDKKLNPFIYFFKSSWHQIKHHFSKKYRERFKLAVSSLDQAIVANRKMQELQTVNKLRNQYKHLKAEKDKVEREIIINQHKIILLEKAIKREEQDIKELLNDKVNHKSILILLERFFKNKTQLDDHLSLKGKNVVSGLTGRLRNAVGMPSNDTIALKDNLNAIQQEMDELTKGYPNLVDASPTILDAMINEQKEIIEKLKDKLKEKNSSDVLLHWQRDRDELKAKQEKLAKELLQHKKEKAKVIKELIELEHSSILDSTSTFSTKSSTSLSIQSYSITSKTE